jgi:hypothetical protein
MKINELISFKGKCLIKFDTEKQKNNINNVVSSTALDSTEQVSTYPINEKTLAVFADDFLLPRIIFELSNKNLIESNLASNINLLATSNCPTFTATA